MKRQLLKISFVIFSVFLLSACSVEELLEGALEIIQSQGTDNENGAGNEDNNNEDENQVENENNANKVNEEENNDPEEAENNSDANSPASSVNVDSSLPFDERLIEQGYDILYMPNGFPYEVPYHWIYVRHQLENKFEDDYLGTFCYDLPLQTQDVASYFDFIPGVEQTHYGEGEDIIHRTSFPIEGFGEATTNYLDFYIDQFGNTCADATVDHGLDGNLGESVSEIVYTIDENRSIPDGFADTLNYVSSGRELEGLTVPYEDLISVRDRIYNRELEIDHLVNGHPVIFPYEWYLVEKIDVTDGFIGEFCTDRTMHEAIAKHQEMLGNMHANIEYFSIEASTRPNVASETAFAFNDEYGTGSWSGVSMFYANPDPNSGFPNHNCVRVEMEFSTDIIN